MKVRSLFLILCFVNFFAHAEEIIFSANSMHGIAGNKNDETTLLGSAYVKTASIELSADSISMHGKDFRFIEAAGTISGKNIESKMEFTCQKFFYDRETKIARFEDAVSLIDTENKVTAKAEIIEYDQNTDIATMQIAITLTQKENTCTGEYALYRKKNQMLELSGNAHIKQKDDTFSAQEITLNLDTQEITLDGKVKGSVVNEDKKTSNTSSEATETSTNKNESLTNEKSTSENESLKNKTQDSTNKNESLKNEIQGSKKENEKSTSTKGITNE